NYYDEEDRINEYALSLFIREDSGMYRKYQETHFQRAYELAEMKKLVEQAGLEFITAYDAFTRKEPTDTSERICVVAREREKRTE
ncbi:MAG: class I SAM-dependent methyltransferase, partial [Faecalimonas sp.]|nr:class I SAM-dependent methyltransferase [Faecalimonas sp.]